MDGIRGRNHEQPAQIPATIDGLRRWNIEHYWVNLLVRKFFNFHRPTIPFSPAPVVKEILDNLGFQVVNYSVPIYGSVIKGYLPCVKRPTVGFSFPAQAVLENPSQSTSIISKKAKNFKILPSQWAFQDNGNNNCTAILIGLAQEVWIMGQPFFEGHYLDFNRSKNYTMGFADLKDPHNVSASD